MRKLILAAITLSLASCGPETGTDENRIPTEEVVEQQAPSFGTTPEQIPHTDTALNEPVFTHPEIHKHIATFEQIKDAYMLALKEADAVKMQDLNMQYMDWYQQTQDLLQRLKGSELIAFKAKLAEMNKEWELAAEAAVQ